MEPRRRRSFVTHICATPTRRNRREEPCRAARLLVVGVLCAGVSAASADAGPTRFEFRQTEMAVPIQIILYADDAATAATAAQAAFARFHQLNGVLSDYDPNSELRRLCDTSGGGKAVPVSRDLWRVLVRAEGLSRRSDGAFDVTIGPVVRLCAPPGG